LPRERIHAARRSNVARRATKRSAPSTSRAARA
jgi:hypothetical protein